ncbi:unnamed protein product [Brassica rapa subsp. narinosa]
MVVFHLLRTLLTSTTRLFLWTLHTMPSEMIQGSSGSATQCTSTESSEGSPQRERRIVVFVERVTTTSQEQTFTPVYLEEKL